jgi:AmmeMemoRadiSam system protein B
MLCRARFANSFYEGNKEALIKQIEKCFKNKFGPKKKEIGKARAIIVPHAGYVFSGPCAAYGYASLDKSKTIVIWGTNHRRIGKEAFILPDSVEGIELPIGKVNFDRDLIKKIHQLDFVEKNNKIVEEHSIEVQLPFIKYLSNSKVIPILVNTSDEVKMSYFIDEILKLGDFSFVFTSDFTHYGIAYGFVPFEEEGKRLKEKIYLLDKEVIDNICNLDIENFKKSVKKANVCGGNVLLLSIILAKKMNLKPYLLIYYTSGDVVKDYGKEAIVGYASFVFK